MMSLKALLLFSFSVFSILFLNQENTKSNAKASLGNGLALWEGMKMHSHETMIAQDTVDKQ